TAPVTGEWISLYLFLRSRSEDQAMSYLLNLFGLVKRFLEWFARSWLLSLLGVLLLSLLIWYEGPLLSFDGREPLASESWRWRLIVMLVALWGGYLAWRGYVAWRANRQLMAGVAN